MTESRRARHALPARLRSEFERRLRGSSSSEAVYETVSHAIVRGDLPAGRPLREVELAELFAVSRTPIREALARLETEQLATRSRRGLIVSEITATEIIEIYELREVLDGLAARLAAQYRTESDLVDLRALHDRIAGYADVGDTRSMARLNVQFHRALAKAARNAMLLSFVDAVHQRVLRFKSTTFEVEGRAGDAVEEHARLIEAVAAGDALAAESIALEHMARARKVRIGMQARDWPIDSNDRQLDTRDGRR